jgi:hypothetical protein
VAANVNYNLRNSHNIHVPLNRLSVYLNSYFPCTIPTWNSLDLTIRNLPTFSSFKLKLQQIFYTKRRNAQYYYIGDSFLSVLHSRMRNKCSALNADLYHANSTNMKQFISQLSVSFPNNNKSIFTGIPIKFNLFIQIT